MDATPTATLRQAIERSLAGAFDPADVLPRLARLVRLAPEGSDASVFAHRKLAELVVEHDPWRAALHVRRVLAHHATDDGAWAILGLCQTLLGNFRYAVRAYERAVASAPTNPSYAHNLGHLLDVALGAPARAVPWLARAHAARPESTELVASLAHALGRAGRLAEGIALVRQAQDRPSRELEALLAWLEAGAPRPPGGAERGRRARREPVARRLARELSRGLASLPLDAGQRRRAMTLARDALPAAPPGARPELAATAAAVAYAIVYVDHVPLSAAEVAAPFRVGVAEVRGRFAELRARLDIIRGDARYASTRR